MPSLKTAHNILTQCFRIPAPTLTEKNLPDQSGKIFIVTGANTGIGRKLASILYGANATVYAAGRDPTKVSSAAEAMQQEHPQSTGRIEVLKLDLADLPSIKGSAEEFLRKADRLDVLWNNAGVMMPPHGSRTQQGHELQMGTNCLGPYIFTELLRPLLEKTAATAAPNSVRVAWAGSLVIDTNSPKGGTRFDEKGSVRIEGSPPTNYGVSKAGNLYLAQQFAKEVEGKGIVSVCFNPGNLQTDLQRHVTAGAKKYLAAPINAAILYEPILGAYTELYSGLSSDLTTADNGAYIAPWGRKSFNRSDIEAGKKSESEGGNGNCEKFVDFVRRETRAYL